MACAGRERAEGVFEWGGANSYYTITILLYYYSHLTIILYEYATSYSTSILFLYKYTTILLYYPYTTLILLY